VYDSERTLYLSHNNTLSLDDALSTVVSKTRESSRLRVSERTLSKSQSLVTAGVLLSVSPWCTLRTLKLIIGVVGGSFNERTAP